MNSHDVVTILRAGSMEDQNTVGAMAKAAELIDGLEKHAADIAQGEVNL